MQVFIDFGLFLLGLLHIMSYRNQTSRLAAELRSHRGSPTSLSVRLKGGKIVGNWV